MKIASILSLLIFVHLQLSLGRELNWEHPQNHYENSRVKNLPHPDENAQFWLQSAQNSLKSRLSKPYIIEKEAKNIIFFMGDGMGVSTVTASRIYKGQKANSEYGGEEAELYMDNFPILGAAKTFCTDRTVADSACSATAYLCGTKANERTMGVAPSVLEHDCILQMQKEHQVESILEWARQGGKSTGIVTTSRITHASPGAAYAHIASRDWENDYAIDNNKMNYTEFNSTTCDDIAEQLIHGTPGKFINVLMGGGRANFLDKSIPDEETQEESYRHDGRNLIEDWIKHKEELGAEAHYITYKEQLDKIDPEKTDFLLGLFEANDIQFADEAEENKNPRLKQMTELAVKILRRNPKGFFLFVESGRIDSGHHENRAKKALIETLELDESIEAADKLTNEDETLIIVTADHSHTFAIAGYPHRGNPLFEPTNERVAMDKLPYTSLSYANGPGYKNQTHNETYGGCIRHDISQDEDYNDRQYRQLPGIHLDSGTHAGEDVYVFAKGPFAHLLTGIFQQNYIPHVLSYAACIGPYEKFCDREPKENFGSKIELNYLLTLLSISIIILSKFK